MTNLLKVTFMLKYDLLQLINEKSTIFYSWIEDHDDVQFEVPQIYGKWSAGQHVEHIRKSTKAMCKALKYPRIALWYKFGTADRVELSYKQIKTKYLTATASGFQSPKSFLPRKISNQEKWKLLGALKEQEQELKALVSVKNESYLSKYLLPHPIFDKLTIREMLMFMAYHTEHHYRLLCKYQKLSKS